MTADPGERASFATVLRVGEFRALWLAQAQSQAGDQLARVALSILVFDRTHSAALTALVYALTFVPAIVGGALLGSLADRLPRRGLMIGCDLSRAVLLAGMAIPATPIPVTCCLLVAAVMIGAPFSAAEVAMLPDILGGEAYVVGSGLRMMTGQLAQLAGFALGGVAVAAIGSYAALGVDAATFAASAAILWACIHRRPAARAGTDKPRQSILGGSCVATVRYILGDRRLRLLAGLTWLAAFHVVPEGVAAPYAAALGAGPVAVGLLMAALPAGTALGMFVIVRVAPRRRARMIGPLAFATALPLIACGLGPGLLVSLVLWVLAGACTAYQVPAVASFVQDLTGAYRGEAIALVSSGMIAVQGLGVLAFGALADRLSPSAAIAWAGVAAACLAAPLAVSWVRRAGDAADGGVTAASIPAPHPAGRTRALD